MDKLLSHIERITGERDRPQINVALAHALRDLLGMGSVSILTLMHAPGEAFVWTAAAVDDQGPHIHDDGLAVPSGMVSIDYHPQLMACLQTGERNVSGEDTVFPISKTNGSVSGFVKITGKKLNQQQLALATHLLAIFTNILSLLDYSEIDTLTGLLNRKTFDRHLIRILYSLSSDDDRNVKALRLPRRRQARTAFVDHWLAVVDVDHFKCVNDNFGHLIGDEMLLLIATLMKASFRAHDQLFRFGGEEFVALLKPTEEINAHAVFERFRAEVEAFEFPQAGRLTVSIGYVRVKRHSQPSLVLEHADAALYWAKANGRNRVVKYDARIIDVQRAPKETSGEVEYF
ncbi:MAG: GGDEF domain-containing protein [Betaproteobacteria bacterium]